MQIETPTTCVLNIDLDYQIFIFISSNCPYFILSFPNPRRNEGLAVYVHDKSSGALQSDSHKTLPEGVFGRASERTATPLNV